MRNIIVYVVLTLFVFSSITEIDASSQLKKVRTMVKSSTSSTKFKAPGFLLKDQFDNSYSVRFPRGKVTILIFGDREGSEQIEGWTRPVYNQYKDKIDVYGIAELSAVPSLVRGVVRRIIKSKTKYSVLLDWSGDVSKSYGYEKGKANVFVIGKDGRVLAKLIGAASGGELQKIYQAVNRGL